MSIDVSIDVSIDSSSTQESDPFILIIIISHPCSGKFSTAIKKTMQPGVMNLSNSKDENNQLDGTTVSYQGLMLTPMRETFKSYLTITVYTHLE